MLEIKLSYLIVSLILKPEYFTLLEKTVIYCTVHNCFNLLMTFPPL